MAREDEEKTPFIAPGGMLLLHLYALRVEERWCHIPSGHAGVPWSIDWANVKAYIDGIVVKTKHHGSLLRNLEETLNNLRKFNLKLNPKNASLVFPRESYSVSWSPIGESKLTTTRSKLSNDRWKSLDGSRM
jgi:hypothetical protein